MLSRFQALNSGLRSDRGNIQRSTASLETSSAERSDDKSGFPLPVRRSFKALSASWPERLHAQCRDGADRH